jgi:hypothetical protein
MKSNVVVEHFHGMMNRLLIESEGCKDIALARPHGTELKSPGGIWFLFRKRIRSLRKRIFHISIICVSGRFRVRRRFGISEWEEFRGERKVESDRHRIGKPNRRICGAGDERVWRITSHVRRQTGIVSAATVGSEGSMLNSGLNVHQWKCFWIANYQYRSIGSKFQFKFLSIVFGMNPRMCWLRGDSGMFQVFVRWLWMWRFNECNKNVHLVPKSSDGCFVMN